MTGEPSHGGLPWAAADVSGGQQQRQFTLLTVVLLVVAAVWSIAARRYAYDDEDAACQLPMVLNIMNPTLLNRDPLVAEVAVRYQSLSFYVLAAVARFTSLPVVYAACFVIVRLATIFAFYHLAYVCTANRAAALVATFLLACCAPRYLTMVPLLEPVLKPRGIALPFLLMTMASMVRERHEWSALWLSLTFLIHPVTGVDLTGVYFVYNILAFRHLDWPAFRRACLAIACFIGSFTALTTRFGLPAMSLTPEWRTLIDIFVPGPYVFLFPYALSTPFWTPMIAGTIMLVIIRPRPLVSPFWRFLAAGVAGVVVHCVTSDWLGIVLLMQSVPARATVTCLVLAIIAQGVGIVFLWDRGTLLTRSVACLLLLDLCFGLRFRTIMMAVAIAVIYFHRKQQLPAPRPVSAWRNAILPAAASFTLLAVVSVVFGPLPERLAAFRNGTSTEFRGLQDLAKLGMCLDRDGSDRMEVQRWIREHSDIQDLIFPPVGAKSKNGVPLFGGDAPGHGARKILCPVDRYAEGMGWQVFSERACAFHGSLRTYVHMSPSFAMRCRSFEEDLPRGPEASWKDVIQFALERGADWIVIDDRAYPRRKGDPQPVFSAGAYHVVTAARKAAAVSDSPGLGRTR
jgi:hypothetical protein